MTIIKRKKPPFLLTISKIFLGRFPRFFYQNNHIFVLKNQNIAKTLEVLFKNYFIVLYNLIYTIINLIWSIEKNRTVTVHWQSTCHAFFFFKAQDSITALGDWKEEITKNE